MAVRNLTEAGCHFGGVVGTARWQGHVEQLEKPSSPIEKSVEQGRSHNRQHRESDRRRDGGGQARSSGEAG